MILSKTPLRVSFCGGGSDIASFYRKHEGCVLSTAIDKYIYLSSVESFHTDITQLKYSTVETVKRNTEIRHPVFRDCLTSYNLSGMEISSISDIPAGTGLGSSSTFTVGLVNLLRTYKGLEITKEILASEACDIEIEHLHEPIGKQDQYAAAYGDLNFIKFKKDDTVSVERVKISDYDKEYLNDNLMMFYLGGTRSASEILKTQQKNITSGNAEKGQLKLCDLTYKLREKLENGELDALGEILDEGWKIKRTLAQGISNDFIDGVYARGISAGALGGKLLGAGGNGFMLFYVPEKFRDSVVESLHDLRLVPMRFDTRGSRIVYTDDI